LSTLVDWKLKLGRSLTYNFDGRDCCVFGGS